MKTLIALLLSILALAACVPQPPSADTIQTAIAQTQQAMPPTSTPAPTPTPTPQLSCDGSLCIKDVRVSILDKTLVVQFQLTDKTGKVNFGENLVFSEKQLIGLYIVENEDDEGEFLGAFNMPTDQFTCYQGNDIPWAEGELTAVCSFTCPIALLQKTVPLNAMVRVENVNHSLVQVATVTEFEK